MKVSVIIPAHNPNMSHLRRALASAQFQIHKPHEIIIIDDASDVPIAYSENLFTLIRTDKNLGPSGARNLGIQKSTGELISFLDADDYWMPKKLQLSVKAFEEDPDIGMTCGNYRWLINKKLGRPFYRTEPRITFETLKKVNLVPSGSVTVRRDVLDDIGMFDERYWVGEDYELWLRISEKYPVKFLNKVLYVYRREAGANSLSVRKDMGKRVFNIEKFGSLDGTL